MRIRFAKLLPLHLAGNAVLLLAAWYWLGVPDRNTGYIAISVLLGLAIVFGFVLLQGSAVAAFRPEAEKMPFRWTLRRVHKAALGVVLVLVVPALAIWLAGYAPLVSAWLASLLTSTFRKPVKPSAVGWICPALLWMAGAAWFLSALRLVASGAAALRSRAYWLRAVPLLAAGLLVPYFLLSWVPGVKGLTAQSVSLALRLLLAYVVLVAAWLLLARSAAEVSAKG